MGKNRICELLCIRYPLIQAPMNWVSGVELVAAVSNAGGLGTLGPNAGAQTIEPDVQAVGNRLREQIRTLRSLTRNPFAVNIAIGSTPELRQYSQQYFEVIVEERVPVAIVSVGSPETYTKPLKEAGVKVLQAVSTATHARKAEAAGVDAVICEGFEGGGHKGFTELTTFVLVPLVEETVRLPIVAGGGIADARGVVAAMALGADGIYMGTRFMATTESSSHVSVKRAIVGAQDACTVSVPKAKTLGRDLRNEFTREYLEMKSKGHAQEELDSYLKRHSMWHAQVQGDADGSEICCGQVAALIGKVASVASVMDSISRNVPTVEAKLEEKLSPFA